MREFCLVVDAVMLSIFLKISLDITYWVLGGEIMLEVSLQLHIMGGNCKVVELGRVCYQQGYPV